MTLVGSDILFYRMFLLSTELEIGTFQLRFCLLTVFKVLIYIRQEGYDVGTHSFLEIPMTNVCSTLVTFDDNFGMHQKFIKHK